MNQVIQNNLLIVSGDMSFVRPALEAAAGASVHAEVLRRADSLDAKLSDRPWDMVMLDSDLLGDDMLATIQQVGRKFPEVPIVAVSDVESVDFAVSLMRSGCADFIAKPVDRKRLDRRLEKLRPIEAHRFESCDARIIGKSAALRNVLEIAARAARCSMPLLITGESGTGKELVSRYVHELSRRNTGPYMRVNCAAMSESLLESELFGHERGAFTGAVQQRKGLFERADGGTLLLDEVSETSPSFQAKLLRVLEQQDFERVGGTERICVNVRVIGTSNRDLNKSVENDEFRRDLYYRLAGLRLRVPPLRERTEDIPLLAWYFVNQYAMETNRRITRIEQDMMDALTHAEWPGNVRQLRNVIRTALVMGEGQSLKIDSVAHLQQEMHETTGRCETLSLRDVERHAILEALRRTDQHYTKAADLLGITDRTLREKVRRYRKNGTLETAGESRWLTETT